MIRLLHTVRSATVKIKKSISVNCHRPEDDFWILQVLYDFQFSPASPLPSERSRENLWTQALVFIGSFELCPWSLTLSHSACRQLSAVFVATQQWLLLTTVLVLAELFEGNTFSKIPYAYMHNKYTSHTYINVVQQLCIVADKNLIQSYWGRDSRHHY